MARKSLSSAVASKLALVVVMCLCAPLVADDAKPSPLSDLEQAQMRAVNLEVQRVNALYELANAAKDKADHAAADAQEHVTALKAELEKARPGWTIDMATGKWTKTEPPKKE